jgi:thioredoxin-dependent peroxiredoxin
MKSSLKCVVGSFVLGFVAWSLSGALAGGDNKVKVGDKAPAFQSVDDQGKEWKSAAIVGKGKTLVLYFYPADFTGGCTAQACSFRDDIEKLHGQNIEVVGVSGDSVATHKLFKNHHKLTFTLLADEKGTVAKMFGVPVGKGGKAKGFDLKGDNVEVVRESTIQRYTVVIDKKGVVVALDKVGDAGGDSKRVAEMVKKLDTK